MSRKKFNSRRLRQLGEEIVRRIAEEEEISPDEQADYVTSLVRQWITYDGNATLLLGTQQLYLVLGKDSPGQFFIVPEPNELDWMNHLRETWKIPLEELPKVLSQLNLGQSAEVTSIDGIALRVWVDPQKRTKGVERLVKPVMEQERNYHKIAVQELEQHVGRHLAADKMEALACSVAKQWREYEGYACIFLDEQHQVTLTITEQGQRGSTVVAQKRRTTIKPFLDSLGFPPEAVPEVIARLNLGQEIAFQDIKGIPSLLSLDPKAMQFRVQKLDSAPRTTQSSTPPMFCPKCGAVLPLGIGPQGQKTCTLCGYTVSPR